jgi:DNA-binding beta-propeller fold protein YncE
MPRRLGSLAAIAATTALAGTLWLLVPQQPVAQGPRSETPHYVVDPFWPKPLPNRWGIGQVAGIAVDSRDHIWIIQRPRSLTVDEAGAAQNPPRSECCVPAPSVMVFDVDGNLVRAWGGPGHHPSWPEGEHGIFVDHRDNVWIAGNANNDHVVLKFTLDGRFLMQIGEHRVTGGSNDTARLGRPADMEVDPETNEVYVADGYQNRRVIVFDGDTGAYRRHWGAYGRPPIPDAQLPAYNPAEGPAQTFRNPVHCVRIARDGMVYVCDRVNNRIQVFRKDGTFVREFFVARNTLGNGSVWDIDLLPDREQSTLITADGENQGVWLLARGSGDVVNRFGRNGRMAGEFHWIHNLAVDSRGNVYTAEVDTGKRTQRFRLTTPLVR